MNAERKHNQLSRTLGTLLSLIWKLDPVYFLVLILNAVSQAGVSLLTIYIPRILIDGFAQGWRAGTFTTAIVLILAGRYLLLQLVAAGKRWDRIHREKVNQLFPAVFADKVMRLDYASLEDSNVLDLKERALFPVTSYGAIYQLFEAFMDLFSGAFTLIGVSVILLNFSPWFTLLILALAVISMLLNKHFMQTFKDITEQLIPLNRRYGYYADTSTRPDFQKEFRIYGMNTLMTTKINSYTDEIRDWLHQVYVTQADTRSGQTVVTAVSRFITYSYVALRVLTDTFGPRVSLGNFSVIVGATESFATAFVAITGAVMNVIQNVGFLEPFCAFLELPESAHQTAHESLTGDNQNMHEQPGTIASPVASLRTLEFEDVSFTYPNSDRLILDRVSFKLHQGEKISIVGLNNAGKSTIVKLICHLFEPDSGRILWNGTDIQELEYDGYIALLSAVFQDFQLFPFSIGENIDPARNDEAIAQDPSAIKAVLDQVGILDHIETLPGVLATQLDKSLYEDATDLSGGQKQKLAIARALYKKADLIILDEPTAALDPLAEAEVYEHFNELTEGRTAIFISHRMSSSTFCDRILLLQDGRVAAYDSHDNLMCGHNLYRDLFETQAKNYRTDPQGG